MAALLDAGQDLSPILADLAAIDGGRRLVDEPRNGQQRANFSASARQARALARSAAVLWIEPAPEATPSDERADQLLLGNINVGTGRPTSPGGYLSSLSSLGLGTAALSSEIVDVLDTGVQLSGVPSSATCVTPTSSQVGHPDLNNSISPNFLRLAYACPSAPSAGNNISNIADGYGHGTLVTSIFAGNPAQGGGALSLFTPPDFNPPDSVTDPDDLNAPHTGGFLWNTGVAPGVRFGSTKFFTDAGIRPDGQQSLSTLANTAYANGARYQNSSWNTGVDSYTLDSHDYDLIVRNAGSDNATHSMTVVFSAGNYPNGGPLNTNAPATAKNVISVGASGILRTVLDGSTPPQSTPCTSAIGINDVTNFSSRGAAYNAGIFKPDLVAPGQVVIGALSTATYFRLNDCYGSVTPLPSTGQHSSALRGLYYPGQGTSYAAPQVTGAAVLVKKALGAAAPSLIKAVLVANAESMHGGTDHQSNAILGWEPSRIQGWGRLSLKRFFDFTPRVYWSENPAWTFTATGQSRYITLTVSDPAKPVLLALAWTDLPGQPGSPSPLVNSIALYVYNGNNMYCDGLNYYGGQYHTPQNGCWLAPDQVNNVKMIRIAPNTFPANGQFTIQVYALGINGIPGPGVPLSQDWSAYVYNAR
jgi:Subtilase family